MKMIKYRPTTYKCSSLDHIMRETSKCISFLEWSSFVDIVDFVEVVVFDVVSDVGPELQGEEGNRAGITICLQ